MQLDTYNCENTFKEKFLIGILNYLSSDMFNFKFSL